MQIVMGYRMQTIDKELVGWFFWLFKTPVASLRLTYGHLTLYGSLTTAREEKGYGLEMRNPMPQ